MKREIKFKVWKKSDKFMFDFEDMITQGWKMDTLLPSDDYVVLEYTGIPDKNGKDIYEGDIVKPANNYLNDHHLTRTLFVERLPISFRLTHKTIKYRQELTRMVEVIGNIYQNPELLN